MLSVGIDAGTFRWSGVKLKSDKVIETFVKKTSEIKMNLEGFSQFLVEFIGDSTAVLPSAFGSPFKLLKDIPDDELKKILLKKEENTFLGLFNVLQKLKKSTPNCYLIPSVKLLATVPSYKKVNKIDMGTSDKVCVAFYAVINQIKRVNITYDKTSFLLVEIGSGFTSLVFVDHGKIVDGIGGTTGPLGIRSRGCVDGELVLLDNQNKSSIYSGGVDSIQDKDLAIQSFIDSLTKYIGAMISSNYKPEEIIISKSTDQNPFLEKIIPGLYKFGKPYLLSNKFGISNAAYGAGLIAQDIANNSEMINNLNLNKINADILDFLF